MYAVKLRIIEDADLIELLEKDTLKKISIKAYRKQKSPNVLPQMTLHGLRHSFTTRTFDNDYNVKEVYQHLGILNTNTTMRFYIHYTQKR